MHNNYKNSWKKYTNIKNTITTITTTVGKNTPTLKI